MAIRLVLIFALSPLLASAGLNPIFLQKDKLLYESDFSKTDLSDKKQWKIVQKTRWSVKDGNLLGQAATREYQASRKDHNGNRPMIRRYLPAENFIAEWKVKYTGTKNNMKAEFGNAFGVHVSKICFHSQDGIYLTGGIFENKIKVPADSHLPKSGKWYTIMAEIKGDEMVVQIKDGAILYMKHPHVAHKKEVLQFQGIKQGTIEVEFIKFWGVKDKPLAAWTSNRKHIKYDKPVSIGKPQNKKKKQ